MSLDELEMATVSVDLDQVTPFEKMRPTAGKILLFSYAFPPMQVQMTPVVFKAMSAIARLGYHVDVLCADSFCSVLPSDKSLLPFVTNYFGDVHRLNPSKNFLRTLTARTKVFSDIPDLMAPVHHAAYQYLMDIDLSQYEAVITWSPFHSINAVMAKVKAARKNTRWVAQFSDPWAGNPLEVRALNKLWNHWHQPQSMKKMDYLVHSSAYSLDLMLQKHEKDRQKSTVLPHVYSEFLYPQRPKMRNDKLTLRYIGILYGRRSPEPVFAAMQLLLQRRPLLKDRLQIELVGQVPMEMLNTPTALSLPTEMIKVVPSVDYMRSLELMYDADILLLIEADIQKNLFLASKVADYLGANTPIVGIVPPGSSRDILAELGCFYASPRAIADISEALERAIDKVLNAETVWCHEPVRQAYKDTTIAKRFIEIVEGRYHG